MVHKGVPAAQPLDPGKLVIGRAGDVDGTVTNDAAGYRRHADAQRQGGQNQVLQFPKARHRQPLDVHGQQENQQQADAEHRLRPDQGRGQQAQMVSAAVGLETRQQTNRNGQQQRHQQPGEYQCQGIAKLVLQVVNHRVATDQTVAQIQLHQFQQPVQIVLPGRYIQPQFLSY